MRLSSRVCMCVYDCLSLWMSVTSVKTNSCIIHWMSLLSLDVHDVECQQPVCPTGSSVTEGVSFGRSCGLGPCRVFNDLIKRRVTFLTSLSHSGCREWIVRDLIGSL